MIGVPVQKSPSGYLISWLNLLHADGVNGTSLTVHRMELWGTGHPLRVNTLTLQEILTGPFIYIHVTHDNYHERNIKLCLR